MDLETFIVNHQLSLRLSAFFGILAVMAAWELAAQGPQMGKPASRNDD